MILSESSNLGIRDFMEMVDNNYPEWFLVMVEAPVETVANTFVNTFSTSIWIRDIPIHVADLDGEDFSRLKAIVQVRESRWSVIYRDVFHFTSYSTDWAMRLSREIDSNLVTFSREETGGDISYQLIQSGEMLEEYLYSGNERFEFQSKLRPHPEIDLLSEQENEMTYADGYTYNSKQHFAFINETFSTQGIYIPACYPRNNHENFQLAISEASFNKVSRADLVNIE